MRPTNFRVTSVGVLLSIFLAAAGCRATENSTRSRHDTDWRNTKVGQTLASGYVVKTITKEWMALERQDKGSGEIQFLGADGTVTRVKKVLGTVGPHSDPSLVVRYPEAFWKKFLPRRDDFLGREYLARKTAENSDPTYAEIEKIVPPILYPETTVGMNSVPHSVSVSASGAVSLDIGLISGVELSSKCHFFQNLNFLLDGRAPTAQECEANIRRGLLAGWMPATDFRYRMADRPVGWEQSVLMGRCQGRPGLFIRFRIVNFDDQPRTVTFAIDPPAGGRFEHTAEGLTVFAPKTPFFNSRISFAQDPARTEEYLRTFSVPLWEVPFSTSIPCAFDDGKPSWKFALAAGGSRDLYLFYPGGDKGKLTRLPDGETEAGFYAALKGQYDSWSAYLENAAQIVIPEPGMEDIFRATLCRILTTAHGDKFEGGVHYYRGFWPFTHLHGVRLMTAAGMFDKARASLAWFMDKRIQPNGIFLFDGGQTRYQLFDIGEFLQALSDYSLASGDYSLITERQEVIGRLYKLLRDNRAKSFAKFRKGDPRRGMFLSSFENDVPQQDYYYTSDVHAWFGLRDYAAVLRGLAGSRQGRGLERAAKDATTFANEIGANLRASFDKAGIIRDAAGKMVAFACKPDLQKEGLKSPFFTNEKWDSYRRFQQQPRMFAHGFATDEETAAFLDFQTNNDQLVLGVRRHLPRVLDDFVAFETDYQYLRLGRVRQFLTKYFAYVQTMTTPGCWTGFEETYYRPDPGMNARASMAEKFWPENIRLINTKLNAYEGLHGTIVVPMLIKQMFCFDEPGQDAVWLGAGVSTHWLKDGQPLTAKHLGSRYGLIDLALTWKAAARTLTAEITPQPGRTMTEVRLRLRVPDGKTLKSATLADGANCEIKGDLVILRTLTQQTTVIAEFAE